MPLISVLLPVFNGEDILARAIDSILAQSLSDLELVVVNNGSTDQTEAIIQSYSDSRIRYHAIDQADLVEALNYGLTECSAPYIARMDADDYSYPDRLALQYEYLNKHPEIGVVSGLVQYMGEHEVNEGYVHYVNWANTQTSSKNLFLSRLQESALPHPTVMFRRELISQYGPYEKDCPEDFELWNRWMAHGVKAAKVNQVILDWYDRPGRLSRVNNRYSSQAFSEIKARFFSQWFLDKFSDSAPNIYVFGYSPTIKKKIAPFEKHGLSIYSFIDVIDQPKPGCIHYSELPNIDNKFVLSYVADRKGKQQIHSYLLEIGMIEGEDFYMME